VQLADEDGEQIESAVDSSTSAALILGNKEPARTDRLNRWTRKRLACLIDERSTSTGT